MNLTIKYRQMLSFKVVAVSVDDSTQNILRLEHVSKTATLSFQDDIRSLESKIPVHCHIDTTVYPRATSLGYYQKLAETYAPARNMGSYVSQGIFPDVCEGCRTVEEATERLKQEIKRLEVKMPKAYRLDSKSYSLYILYSTYCAYETSLAPQRNSGAFVNEGILPDKEDDRPSKTLDQKIDALKLKIPKQYQLNLVHYPKESVLPICQSYVDSLTYQRNNGEYINEGIYPDGETEESYQITVNKWENEIEQLKTFIPSIYFPGLDHGGLKHRLDTYRSYAIQLSPNRNAGQFVSYGIHPDKPFTEETDLVKRGASFTHKNTPQGLKVESVDKSDTHPVAANISPSDINSEEVEENTIKKQIRNLTFQFYEAENNQVNLPHFGPRRLLQHCMGCLFPDSEREPSRFYGDDGDDPYDGNSIENVIRHLNQPSQLNSDVRFFAELPSPVINGQDRILFVEPDISEITDVNTLKLLGRRLRSCYSQVTLTQASLRALELSSRRQISWLKNQSGVSIRRRSRVYPLDTINPVQSDANKPVSTQPRPQTIFVNPNREDTDEYRPLNRSYDRVTDGNRTHLDPFGKVVGYSQETPSGVYHSTISGKSVAVTQSGINGIQSTYTPSGKPLETRHTNILGVTSIYSPSGKHLGTVETDPFGNEIRKNPGGGFLPSSVFPGNPEPRSTSWMDHLINTDSDRNTDRGDHFTTFSTPQSSFNTFNSDNGPSPFDVFKNDPFYK